MWHGLLHKPTKGHLTIDVKQEKGKLTFVVEDDGVGRSNAHNKTSQQNGRQSLGVTISEERLRLINKAVDKNNIHIQDLIGADGSPRGTRVVLTVEDITAK
ncbi:MAG: hypothetical protein JNL70_15530 [Saprospiraceae bacterium]|nr:hypothetical protein [Saprospiraceae bacterium]